MEKLINDEVSKFKWKRKDVEFIVEYDHKSVYFGTVEHWESLYKIILFCLALIFIVVLAYLIKLFNKLSRIVSQCSTVPKYRKRLYVSLAMILI